MTNLQKEQIHRRRHEKKTEVDFSEFQSVTRLVNYEANFANHQLCTHTLCVVSLRNSAETFQMKVVHLSPVCSASSKDEHSSGEEKKVDETLVQLRRIQDGALQGYDVSNLWFS